MTFYRVIVRYGAEGEDSAYEAIGPSEAEARATLAAALRWKYRRCSNTEDVVQSYLRLVRVLYDIGHALEYPERW